MAGNTTFIIGIQPPLDHKFRKLASGNHKIYINGAIAFTPEFGLSQVRMPIHIIVTYKYTACPLCVTFIMLLDRVSRPQALQGNGTEVDKNPCIGDLAVARALSVNMYGQQCAVQRNAEVPGRPNRAMRVQSALLPMRRRPART